MNTDSFNAKTRIRKDKPRTTRTTRKLFPLRLDRGEGQGEVSKFYAKPN